MHEVFSLASVMTFAVTLTAQSPLSMPYTGNNSGIAGGQVFFDLQVNTTITIQKLDINTGAAVGTAGTIEVYLGPSTYVGNTTTAGNWTLQGSGPISAAGSNVPTPCCLNADIVLPPGSYGVALRHIGVPASYTNGNGTAVPGSGTNQTGSTAEVTLRAGLAQNAPWTGGFTPRVFNGSIYYANGVGSHTCAAKSNYGPGCYSRVASTYENFATANTFDLSGTTVTMMPNGNGGYDVSTAPLTSFFTPLDVGLGLTDDSLSAPIALPYTIPYPGGSTNTIVVHSNGQIFLGSSGVIDFSPTVAELLSRGPSLSTWWDAVPVPNLNPGGQGDVVVDIVRPPRYVYVTYNGVTSFGFNTPWTLQVCICCEGSASPGGIEFRFQSFMNDNGPMIFGFTPGNGAGDPGNRDISATAPYSTSGPEAIALALAASARPLTGTTIQLVTSNIPATSPLGFNVLSFGPAGPINLIGIGAPDCYQNVNLGFATTMAFFGNPTASVPLGIPPGNAFVGVNVFSQSASIVPGVNAAGLLTSNGVQLTIGNL